MLNFGIITNKVFGNKRDYITLADILFLPIEIFLIIILSPIVIVILMFWLLERLDKIKINK